MIKDDGVSELMGYTVLVAVVSIASAALLAGSMGTLSASEKSLGLGSSVSSLRSFDDIVAGVVSSNNTYDSAFEMSVPPGCDLAVRDKHDDFRSISIYSGSTLLAFLPIGSVTISSSFRSVTFEGGAVISNDTGLVKTEIKPAMSVAPLPSGKKALYMSVPTISSRSFIDHSGPVTLYARCNSSRPMSWHIPDGSTVIIYVRSGNLAAWKEVFDGLGLAASYENGALKASGTGISDIYVTYAEADIHE